MSIIPVAERPWDTLSQTQKKNNPEADVDSGYIQVMPTSGSF